MLKIILLASTALALAATSGMAASERERTNHLMPGQLANQTNSVPPPGKARSDFAVVNSNNTLARGRNVLAVDNIAPGVSVVHFASNKTQCAYTATVGLSGSSGTSAPGYATVVGAAVDPNGVFMDTYNPAGSNAALGYHLATHC
jgi:hypothetical protein